MKWLNLSVCACSCVERQERKPPFFFEWPFLNSLSHGGKVLALLRLQLPKKEKTSTAVFYENDVLDGLINAC